MSVAAKPFMGKETLAFASFLTYLHFHATSSTTVLFWAPALGILHLRAIPGASRRGGRHCLGECHIAEYLFSCCSHSESGLGIVVSAPVISLLLIPDLKAMPPSL